MKIQQEINNIINQITQNIPISEIYLFGSYAYGTPTSESDIDLCIITNDNETRKRELVLKIRRAIAAATDIPVDTILYRHDEFYERADLPFTMEYKIKNEGINLYKRKKN